MELDRLQKIIAHAGFASRREAEAMIKEGRVTINGRVVKELGTKADPNNDHIKVDGKLITRAETHRYILLYKPKEVMSTVNDPEGRKTVVDLVKGVRERIYPVGRLDYQSEGLLLLTNDGDLAYKVSHPQHGSVKTYHVKVRGVPDERIIGKLERGITIDGKRTVPCEIERMKTTGKGEDAGNSWFEVRLREGRNQQIRKMFKAVGHPVSKLRRVAIGPIADPHLSAGDWRELTPKEVKMLATMQEMPKPKPRRAASTPRATAKKAAAATATSTTGTRGKKAAAPAKKRTTTKAAPRPTTSTRKKAGPRKAGPLSAAERRKATPLKSAPRTASPRGASTRSAAPRGASTRTASPRTPSPRTASPRKAAGASRRGRG